MVVVVHGVARKMASIAKGSESFLGDFVPSLGRFVNDVSRNEVVVVEILGQSIFSVTDCFL
jgi:hypothetical protein